MKANEPPPLDEQWSALLIACDEALAEGSVPEVPRGAAAPPELRARLERGLACLQRLQRLRPRHRAAPVAPVAAPPRQPRTTDHNLLFGVLALQADLIDSTQFVEACTLWATRKQVALADLLVEKGWLQPRDRGDVQRLLERKLRKHGNNAHAGLAAVADNAVRHVLAAVEDAAIHESLISLPEPERPTPLTTVDYVPQARQRYTLTRLHGKGGVGQVWFAHDDDLDRNVALKELWPERAQNAAVVERFLNEARITGQLEHPGIVPIYEMVRGAETKSDCPTDQHPFYTMRFIKGQTLTEAIQAYHQKRQTGQAGPLELIELLNAFVAVCQAVAYAHSRGVIHRDLKGQNVVLGKFGEVIVLDWGFAKILASGASDPLASVPTESTHESHSLPVAQLPTDNAQLTLQGQVVGTPAYMAPEQADGRLDELDRRTDVYGLGAMLYELLTGRPPFTGSDVQEVLRKVRAEEPARPRQVCASVPPALEAVCLRALAKKPAERYASAAELAREVQQWLADEPPQAYREPLLARLGRWARWHKPHVAGLSAVLLTVVIALVVGTMLIREKEMHHALIEQGLEERAAMEAQTRELVEATGYLRDIFSAAREVADGKVARADEHLEACKYHLRNWEWHYLHRRTHRCVLTLRGHEQGVISVVYSPDGKYLAAGADEPGIVMIWDTTTGQLIHTLSGPLKRAHAFRLGYRRDGKHLAVANSGENTPHIWDTTNGTEIRHNIYHQVISCVAYSPDGQYLATTSTDRTVKIWNATTGQGLNTFRCPFPAAQVAYSPDGKRLAVSGLPVEGASEKGIVLIMDVETGDRLHTLRGLTSYPNSITFSPDGRLLAACELDGGSILLWDTTTGKAVHVIRAHNGRQSCVAFHPDGKLLASAGWEGSFKVWDVATGQLVRTFHGHRDFVAGVAFSPDKRHLATCSRDKTVRIWDITELEKNTGPEAVTLPAHAAGVRGVAFSRDGQLFASAGTDQTIKVWNAQTGKEIQSLPGHMAEVFSVAFHPHGKRLASASADGTVKLWDATAGKETHTLLGHTGPVHSVVFSADGQYLASAGDDKSVRLWNATTGQSVKPLPDRHKDAIHGLAFSPDGQQLASVDAGGTLWLWDAPTGQALRSVRSQLGEVGCVTFSGNGHYLAWAGPDRMIKVWDLTAPLPQVPRGREAEPATLDLKGHTEPITSLTFSSDGKRLFSASEDKTVKVWDMITGEEALTLRGHTDRVTSLARSPDGYLLVSGSADGTVKLWNGTPLDQ